MSRHLCPDTPCLSNDTQVSIEREATWVQEQVRHYSYTGAHPEMMLSLTCLSMMSLTSSSLHLTVGSSFNLVCLIKVTFESRKKDESLSMVCLIKVTFMVS